MIWYYHNCARGLLLAGGFHPPGGSSDPRALRGSSFFHPSSADPVPRSFSSYPPSFCAAFARLLFSLALVSRRYLDAYTAFPRCAEVGDSALLSRFPSLYHPPSPRPFTSATPAPPVLPPNYEDQYARKLARPAPTLFSRRPPSATDVVSGPSDSRITQLWTCTTSREIKKFRR